jgi:DNA invertase Pin-like site-specific DNA recombinase
MKKKLQLVAPEARRVIVYCRVSTDEQADKGISLDAQEAKGRAYVQLYDLELVEVIHDTATGKTLDRPGLQRALKMLRDGVVDGIVIAKLDRLARKVSIWSELVERYFAEDRPWMLFSVADHVDTRTANGRFQLNMFMTISQWERETIAERTRDALAFLASQGIVLGGAPLGVRREPRIPGGPASKFVEVPAEADIVRYIRTLKAMGHGVRDIAEQLNAEKVPTKRGRSWHTTTVQRVLRRA